MSQSQIYGVKSNAARAAKRYGLTRADLIEVTDGKGGFGWYFEIPEHTIGAAALAAGGAPGDVPVFVPPESEPPRDATAPFGTPASLPAPTIEILPAQEPPAVTTHRKPAQRRPAGPAIEMRAFGPPAPAATGTAPAGERPSILQDVQIMSGKRSGKAAKAKRKPSKPVKARTVRATRRGIQATILDTIRTGWTPAPKLCELAGGWLPHTLRGMLSTQAKRQKITIERRWKNGVSEYRIPA